MNITAMALPSMFQADVRILLLFAAEHDMGHFLKIPNPLRRLSWKMLATCVSGSILVLRNAQSDSWTYRLTLNPERCMHSAAVLVVPLM